MFTVAGGVLLALAVALVVLASWRGIVAAVAGLGVALATLAAGAVLHKAGADWRALAVVCGLLGAGHLAGRVLERRHERKRPGGLPGRLRGH